MEHAFVQGVMTVSSNCCCCCRLAGHLAVVPGDEGCRQQWVVFSISQTLYQSEIKAHGQWGGIWPCQGVAIPKPLETAPVMDRHSLTY